MTSRHERPLVTFILFSYNQEEYISDAIDGALKQDYRPLQIIFSDDCSNDNTFSIIEKRLSSYNGSHSVTLNQTPKNLGLIGHINTVVKFAKGELLILAAGDDISSPIRTKEVVSAWLRHGKPAHATIHSDWLEFKHMNLGNDKHRKPKRKCKNINHYLKNWCQPFIHGATAAYTPDLFTDFPLLDESGLVEDTSLSFRSLLTRGEIIYIPKPLVHYRITAANISGRKNLKKPDEFKYWIHAASKYLDQNLNDYYYLLDREMVDKNLRLEKTLYSMKHRWKKQIKLLSPSFPDRCQAIVFSPIPNWIDRINYYGHLFGWRQHPIYKISSNAYRTGQSFITKVLRRLPRKGG